MAEAIISEIVKGLAAIAEEKIRNEVSLVRDVKKEASKLSDELRRVGNMLDDAERKGVKDKNIREWLKRLEYASQEMEDVLDEWNFSRIKLQKEPQDSSSSAASPQHKQVCPFIPRTSCLGFKKIATRREIALKIKRVTTKLDEILKEKNRYNFHENKGTGDSLERFTTSFVEIDDIKGREIDREDLVQKITSPGTSCSQGDQLGSIHFSSIVGTGGLGKTTLAQLIYNDSRVENCFPLRIWICVSDLMDEAKIAKEILEQVLKGSQETPSTNQLQVLLELVKKSISGKKFLLVLDDVWNGNDAKWGPLKSSLKSSCTVGSRILVTTRDESVARSIGTDENEIHRLKQLSDDECWSLLSHIAFFGKNDGTKEGLDNIGQGIAQKCRGLPLAAKTLGSLLRSKNTVEEWKDVLNSEIWQLESVKVELFPHLLLSYNDLPPIQKRCFSYCAVFPKDHEIKVDDLIRKWMALGYLSSSGGNASELELRGREYFNSLANRCLFQNLIKDPSNENVIFKCKMHDIVHDFATSLREEDDLKNSEETSNCKICGPSVFRVKVYRTLLLKGDRYSDLHVCDCLARMRVFECWGFRNTYMEIAKFIHLRNLSIINVNVNENDIRIICMLYNLQSLVLDGCGVREIPSEIGETLSHLRYLDLSCNELKELPKSITDLHELRYLDLSLNKELKELPESISDLNELRHLNLGCNKELKELPESISDLHELRSLDVSYCSLSELPQGLDRLINLKHLKTSCQSCLTGRHLKLPQGLAKLTSLQGLDQFYGRGDCNKLGLLKELNRLSGSLKLIIKLVNDDDDIVEQAREAELRKKTHLQELEISFEDRMDKENKEEEESMRRRLDVMDALEPHPDLQSLTVDGYEGSKFPEWIVSPSFHKLRKITIRSCSSLPHLGKLPCLENLEIVGFREVEFVGREFLEITSSSSLSSIGFPKLKNLKFTLCLNWEEWEDIPEEEEESAAVSVMPSLMELEIYFCGKLKELPHRLLRKASSLQSLRILYSPQLKEAYEEEGGPLNKFISHIPNVEFKS